MIIPLRMEGNSVTRFALFFVFSLAILIGSPCVQAQTANDNAAPNVLWIYVDDMSDWVGCYGHSEVPTPNIDRLAAGGVKFERAYMPSPVCSTTRSALITGAMQTSHGLHHHRTMIKDPLPDDVRTIPELFREAGYITFNEAKDDYNFQRDRQRMYSPEFRRPKNVKSHLVGTDVSWLKQLQGKRFFGQIQLKGGKIGGETGNEYPAESRVREEEVHVPPFYPDHPVFRNAIARHFEQIAETDEQVGAILDALEEYDLLRNTAVFFFTDHGSPLPRSKQFLYEEGTKVPLIVHWPNGETVIGKPGSSRADLVSGIDISSTSLAVAGLKSPEFIEGIDLFSREHTGRTSVICARDRCGIAVDRIRAVRSEHFRYIRNYHTDRALYQSQYRDNYATFSTLRDLLGKNELSPLQASYHDRSTRPSEELYDMRVDPNQTNNLALRPDYQSVLQEHRDVLKAWEDKTQDHGKLPERKACLELVFKQAKGKCPAPEFDFLRKD